MRVISLVLKINEQLGIANYTLKINHLGDEESKENFCQALKDFFKPHIAEVT